MKNVPAPSEITAKFMKDNNVDPAKVTGTGKDGTIIKKDVEKYINANKPAAEKPAASTPAKKKTKHRLPDQFVNPK